MFTHSNFTLNLNVIRKCQLINYIYEHTFINVTFFIYKTNDNHSCYNNKTLKLNSQMYSIKRYQLSYPNYQLPYGKPIAA